MDPDGMRVDVVAKDAESQNIIKKSLSPSDAKHLKFDNDGKVDKNLINQSNSADGNFSALKALVNSETVYEVNTFSSIKLTSGESIEMGNIDANGGFYGFSNPPENSISGNFEVTININNTPGGKVETLGHELYSHGFLHSQGKNWEHNVENQNGTLVDTNRNLHSQIQQRIENSKRNYQLWSK